MQVSDGIVALRHRIRIMLSLFTSFSGLVLPRAPPARMAVVDDFAISKVIKEVRVFDGSYDADICEAVAQVGSACIEEKGSFSLCIPGGSVVAALKGLDKESFDMSKMHIFFANEKIPSRPCIAGGLEVAAALGMPTENVHGFAEEGTPEEIADKYTDLLDEHPSIDNSGAIPSCDMMLLGTGPDGHCGCLFPNSPEIMVSGAGEVVVAGNNANADGDFVAVTMDVMCATKIVLVSAAGAGRAPMVATALSGEFEAYDCPAGMVEAVEDTFWFTDKEGIAEFEAAEAIEEED